MLKIIHGRYPDRAILQAKIKDGFSFDDIAFAAAALGYQAIGAKVAAAELEKLSGPVIVHLDKGKFQHFSVLRKFDGETFYLSDPTTGKVGLPRYQFEHQYTGHALAIWKPGDELPTSARLVAVRDGMSLSSSYGQVLKELFRTSPRIY